MKKFTSLFLVISMIICNINHGVVDALSSYGNEIKSLVKTEEEKIVYVEDDKELEKKNTQLSENNDVDNTKAVDLKNKNEKVQKFSQTKLDTNEYVKEENVILVYDISTETLYYIDSDNNKHEVSWTNKNITENKINLNNVLPYSNLNKVKNVQQKVTLVMVGTGNDIYIDFDNEQYSDVPFNIVFYNMHGTDCQFKFKNIRSIKVKGKNTITNSYSADTALEYSFDKVDSNPLYIYDDSSFIVYNKEKDTINTNIVSYENSGNTSIVNISFEDELDEEKDFILEPSANNSITPKKLSTKVGYNALSILLVSDENDYLLKEDKNQVPYYYRTSNSDKASSQLSGEMKTKFTLKKSTNISYYEVNNKKRVELIADQRGRKKYYLADRLQDVMDISRKLNDDTYEFIFLGNYDINQEDVDAIKSYDKDSNGIKFKTKIDDHMYVLNVDEDIELKPISSNKFYVTFDDIRFNYTSDNNWIYANGTQLNFGSNVVMDGTHYPSVSSGQDLSSGLDSIENGYLIINSGTYNFITGDRYNTVKEVDITINGGTFEKEVSGVSNEPSNNGVTDNVNLTINNNPIFKSKVYGVQASSNINKDLNMMINGGVFTQDVIAVNGMVGKDATLTINNDAVFLSSVLGSNRGSGVVGSLNISIDGGTFRNQVIGINGGTVNNATLTISGGTFNKMLIGVSSDTVTQRFTLKGLLNRYLFSNNARIANDEVDKISSVTTGVNFNLVIKSGLFKEDIIGTNVNDTNVTMTVSGGTFQKTLIGSSGSVKDNATINIERSVTIPTITDFTKLVIGESNKATLTVDNNLDQGHSTGDLYLKNGSTIAFKSTSETSKLNNIILDENSSNTLRIEPVKRDKNIVLIESSGEIRSNTNNKLNIKFSRNQSISELYLIKFITEEKANVEGKYNLPKGYYVRDNKESGYVILYPQTTFDLEYDFNHDKLYMIDQNKPNTKSEAWWYTGGKNSVTLNTDDLYKYKGYDLFKENKKDRNITLTGKGSNKTFDFNSSLPNLNVTLDKINLEDSKIILKNLKSLILNEENTITNINENQDAFIYTFNSTLTDNKVSFKDNNSYLKIFTTKDTKPFNASEGDRMDFKFLEQFESNTTVRLRDNTRREFTFNIPKNTQRLGVLLKNIDSESKYNLYYGTSGDTGSSVYVSGNEEKTFTDMFRTSKNEHLYDYVRCANPVNIIQVDIPRPMNFKVTVPYSGLDKITPENYEYHFGSTDMTVKNNSIVIKDQFKYDGQIQNFGEEKIGLEFGYLGVSPLNKNNLIKLVSKENLNPDITDCPEGVKLSLKFSSESGDNIPIDENSEVLITPLKKWVVPSGSVKTLKVVPDFDVNKHFFNINENTPINLSSSHKFIFRFGLKR